MTKGIQETVRELFAKLEAEQRGRVRIALFGQPGAGKSSIINALTGQPLAAVGARTDMTTECREYEWGQLLLADLPGYGTERFPKDGYFERFNITAFDLFLCVTANKFTDDDAELFRALKAAGKTCIFVRNFRDTLWQDGRSADELEQEIVLDTRKHIRDSELTVVFTSCRTAAGIDVLSAAIAANLDQAKAERWVRNAKAYSHELLARKNAAVSHLATLAAGAAAINALNPVPGADVAIDVGVLLAAFTHVRAAYGLDDGQLDSLVGYLPVLAPVVNRVVAAASRNGVLLLLEKFGGRLAVKQLSKYIPIVGQVIAASTGFAITYKAVSSYVNDCHSLAVAILEHELGRRTR